MRRLAFVPFVLILFLAFAGCEKKEEAEKPEDNSVTTAVTHKLASEQGVAAAGIHVKTNDGVVTLSGTVIGQKEADDAVRLARSVAGVTSVRSQLKVDTNITNADVENRLSNLDKINEEKQEEQDKRDASTIASDADITAKVKLKLAADNLLSTYRIDVDTRNGAVTLTGNVKNEAEAKTAVQLAESVENVKRVVSVLKINP